MYFENEVDTATKRRVYEECKLVITYLAEEDVIAASEPGVGYPSDWNT